MQIDDQFIKEYDNLIWSTIREKVRGMDTQSDVHSDIIIRLIESSEGYDEEKGAVSTWVVWICRSVISNYFLTKARKHDMLDLINTGDNGA